MNIKSNHFLPGTWAVISISPTNTESVKQDVTHKCSFFDFVLIAQVLIHVRDYCPFKVVTRQKALPGTLLLEVPSEPEARL